MIKDNMEKKTEIFGSLFYLANRLETIIDRDFSKYDFTAKQWFLMAVLGRFFKSPPKLKEVSEWMGTSYQNVKQLSLKLEKIGFLELERDKQDKRAIRISLTKKCEDFFYNHSSKDYDFLYHLFEGFSEKEEELFLQCFIKMINNIRKYD